MSLGALQMQPRLRPDLTIVRRESHGKVHYIVKEPREGKYSQFGEAEIALMRLMDGTRTPAAIGQAVADRLGHAVEAGRVADFAQRLKRMGLVERTPAEEHLMLMERIRGQRRVRAGGRTKGSLLRMRFSIGDPDRLFDRVVPRLAWMWTPGFVGVSIALFAIYVVILVVKGAEIYSGAAGLYTHSGVSGWDYALLYLLFLVIVGIHELGHGLTTKRFGGHVHEIGAMLLYFSPALFCNTNDAWLFHRRSHRLWVTFAGPWIQLLIAALAAIAWLFMEPGTLLYRVTFLTILAGGVAGVLGNLNPLIPLDGYYALSDYLEIPNLRKRAFGYWGWLAKRRLLGIAATEPPVSPRERRVFLLYGGLAFAYSIVAALASLIWLTLILRRAIGPWVWPLVLFILGRVLWRHRGRLRALAFVAATTSRAGFVASRRMALVLAAIAMAAALPFLLPWTFRARGEARVEAAPRARVHAPVSGILDEVTVTEGQRVRAAEPLARLWSPELQARLLELETRAGLLDVRRAQAQGLGDRTGTARAEAEVGKVRQEVALLRAKQAAQVLRAPFEGVVLAYRLEERRGAALREGEPLLEIASATGRTARVRLPLRRAGRVAVGQRANLKFPAWPRVTFVSRVSRVSPAARDGWVEAEVPIPPGARLPAPGMTGTAKIVTGRGTVAEAVAHGVRQLVRLDFWI
ncbi:MAG: efflux RND transporter periplasmic adaptor subunit [Gemmatimonadota bacterium]